MTAEKLAAPGIGIFVAVSLRVITCGCSRSNAAAQVWIAFTRSSSATGGEAVLGELTSLGDDVAEAQLPTWSKS